MFSVAVTEVEIEQLFRRFTSLDRSKRGCLAQSDLELIPELSMNPLGSRIISLFTKNDSQPQITFRSFASTLSSFSKSATAQQRKQAIFDIVDVDGDGKISRVDVMHLLKLLVGTNLNDDDLDQLASDALAGESIDSSSILSQLLGEALFQVSFELPPVD